MYEYNEQQQALIDAPFDVPVIGVAAAGGGKTTTMVGRIQRAVRVCPEGKVLAVTFTNKARIAWTSDKDIDRDGNATRYCGYIPLSYWSDY